MKLVMRFVTGWYPASIPPCADRPGSYLAAWSGTTEGQLLRWSGKRWLYSDTGLPIDKVHAPRWWRGLAFDPIPTQVVVTPIGRFYSLRVPV